MIGKVVHIVDDDGPLRESLEFLMTSAGYTARGYDSAAALLPHADNLEPGCIVTDVRMPGMNGLELVAALRERGVTHPIIVLTGHADVPLAVAAMKAGVVDFLEKPVRGDDLVAAVASVMTSGEEAAERAAEASELRERLKQLTGREREVFDAIVGGDSNKAAALRLGISPRTVEIYRANVMAKMKAQSLSALVRMALKCEDGQT